MLDSINGKKTYLLSAVALVYAVSAFFTGNIDANTAIQLILAALGGSALRHSLPK